MGQTSIILQSRLGQPRRRQPRPSRSGRSAGRFHLLQLHLQVPQGAHQILLLLSLEHGMQRAGLIGSTLQSCFGVIAWCCSCASGVVQQICFDPWISESGLHGLSVCKANRAFPFVLVLKAETRMCDYFLLPAPKHACVTLRD